MSTSSQASTSTSERWPWSSRTWNAWGADLYARAIGTSPDQLRRLADRLIAQQVEEAVMESTAQYRKRCGASWNIPGAGCPAAPGAGARAGTWHLAQAQSNARGQDASSTFPTPSARGSVWSPTNGPELCDRCRATPVADADAHEVSMTQTRVQLHNRLEALLEQAHLKLSSLVSDRWASAVVGCCRRSPTAPSTRRRWRRWLMRVCAPHPSNCGTPSVPVRTPSRAPSAATMTLADLALLETQMRQLDHEIADLLCLYYDSSSDWRRCWAWGSIPRNKSSRKSAQLPPPFRLDGISRRGSRVPWHRGEPAVNRSPRSPHGNRQMRRLLNQAAHAAVK